MWRKVTPMVAIVGVAVAVAACSASTKTVTATVTVTTTVTATASAPASTPASAAPASAPASAAPGSEVASLPPAIDPCALLPLAEAETLATLKLNAATEAGAEGTKTLCQYTSDPNGPTAQVEIIVGDGAKKELDIDRGTLGHTFTTVAGIGDECDQEDDNIFIRKGTNWVDINLVRLNDPAQNVQPMQVAAKEVAARLP